MKLLSLHFLAVLTPLVLLSVATPLALILPPTPALAQTDTDARRAEALELNNRGAQLDAVGRYEEALVLYERALAVVREIGERSGEAAILNNIGLVYNALGQYEQALELYEQTLAILIEVGDRAREGFTLNNIGFVYQELGQYEQALEFYEQALAISIEMDDRSFRGTILNNIGLGHNSLGEYEQALEFYEQALVISIEVGDRPGEGTTLSNIGRVYDALGQYEQALEFYEQALTIRNEVGDRQGVGETLNNIGAVYNSLSDYEQALEFYEQAFAISIEVGDREGQAITLNNIGFALASLDEPELAIVFFKQAINQWEAIRGDIRGLEIEQQQAFTERVSRSYRRLADLLLQADRVLEAQRVLDLLQVQELDEYLQDVQRNSDTETGTPLRPVEQEAWQRFAVNQAQLLALGQELRELEAIARGDRTTAQQDRILELRQIQQDARMVFQSFIDSPEIQEIVAQLRTTTAAATLELSELNALQDNLQQLEQRTVALYPLVLEDRLELVLVTANAPPIRRTVNVRREDLNRAIADFRSALQSPSRDAETPAQQLYDWLTRPIESDLAQAETEVILYAPDGQLRYIPLVALHDGNQWVAQQWQVNNIVAASLTDINNQPFPEGFNILAAAFTEGQYEVPISTRTLSFGGLAFARQEVENLAQLIPQTEQRLNQDFDQSMILEMNDFNIIHLATHAAFNPGPPEDSFILFGDGSHVTLNEVRSWTFPNVELVVLSACETAVGDVPLGNGAEVLGLGYLMQQAGAEAAIASLWRVSDGGTQVLMDAFYIALNNGYSKTEALQRAQQALITSDQTVLGGARGDTADYEIVDLRTGDPLAQSGDLEHPYYWAPFILIGNGL
ncbi:MAG: tetratricopeptide repeat protein [Cyanobacteria bacterium J06638_22]